MSDMFLYFIVFNEGNKVTKDFLAQTELFISAKKIAFIHASKEQGVF